MAESAGARGVAARGDEGDSDEKILELRNLMRRSELSGSKNRKSLHHGSAVLPKSIDSNNSASSQPRLSKLSKFSLEQRQRQGVP